MQRYFRLRDLATRPATAKRPATQGRYPVSASTIWRWVQQGRFPKPVKLSTGTTAWTAESIERFDAGVIEAAQ